MTMLFGNAPSLHEAITFLLYEHGLVETTRAFYTACKMQQLELERMNCKTAAWEWSVAANAIHETLIEITTNLVIQEGEDNKVAESPDKKGTEVIHHEATTE
jgi:hypothetical protein